MVMPLMASGALPELLSVATWAAVVAPVTAVELSEAGVSVAVTTETAEKLAVTLCGALMVTVVEALLALATLPVQFRHFYTFAAKVMRMILIDHAREPDPDTGRRLRTHPSPPYIDSKGFTANVTMTCY
jgi:hypothetical protein